MEEGGEGGEDECVRRRKRRRALCRRQGAIDVGVDCRIDGRRLPHRCLCARARACTRGTRVVSHRTCTEHTCDTRAAGGSARTRARGLQEHEEWQVGAI